MPHLIESPSYAQVGIPKYGLSNRSPEELRPIETCPGEVRPYEVGPGEACPGKVGPVKVRPSKHCRSEVCPDEVRPTEVHLSEERLGEVRPAKMRLYFWIYCSPSIPRLHPSPQPCKMFLVRHRSCLLRHHLIRFDRHGVDTFQVWQRFAGKVARASYLSVFAGQNNSLST